MADVFPWCKDCDLYYPCYRWDQWSGEQISGPDFMEPACGEGPLKREKEGKLKP